MSWTPTSAPAHAVYAAGFEYDPAQDIKYNSSHFPSNDPNVVQAQFLDVVGLPLLNVADYYGMAASQLAIEIGKDAAATTVMSRSTRAAAGARSSSSTAGTARTCAPARTRARRTTSRSCRPADHPARKAHHVTLCDLRA
jgi:hypothetical protein